MRADFAGYLDMASVVEQSVKCRNCGEQLFEPVNIPLKLELSVHPVAQLPEHSKST